MTAVYPLTRADTEQLLAINAAAIPAVATLDRQELVRLAQLSDLHLAAFNGNTLLGYLLVFHSNDDYDGEEFRLLRSRFKESFIYIDQVAVRSDARGTGIGRRLYAALEASAAAAGVTLLCCEVNIQPPNPDSLAFHRRLGFERQGVLSIRDGREVALLSKHLPRRATI